MKKLLVFVIAAVLLASCASLHNGQGEANAEQKASQIEDSINNRTFKVEFNYVNPLSMPSHYLTTTYTLRLSGDSVCSFLPYFGRAYRSNPANNDRSPLTFNSPVTGSTIVKGRKKDYTIVFKTRNETELFEYTLKIFLSGQAYLTVNSSDRETISFNGSVVL